MAEEFEGGVSTWWNFPTKNFFGSTNDVAGFDWPTLGTTVIKPTKRSTDDSAGFSSSEDNTSNQDFFGKSEDNYSSHVLNNNFGGDYLNNNNNNPAEKQVNGDYYPLQQHPLNSIERLSAGLVPLGSASYDYTSSLLQTLFETDEPADYCLNSYDHINISNEFLPNIINNNNNNNNNNNHLPFTNNEPATWTNDFLPAPQSQFLLKNKNEGEKKEPAMKRARIQAPSPLPTFKVRKEKLGDRVTALQQLVSPFGKTDTASVLHEAIEYIKYLHDQISVFSSPYLKNKSPTLQHLHGGEKVKQDLKSRGLCLVPISSTFPVTAEITTDFWTPILGDSFK